MVRPHGDSQYICPGITVDEFSEVAKDLLKPVGAQASVTTQLGADVCGVEASAISSNNHLGLSGSSNVDTISGIPKATLACNYIILHFEESVSVTFSEPSTISVVNVVDVSEFKSSSSLYTMPCSSLRRISAKVST